MKREIDRIANILLEYWNKYNLDEINYDEISFEDIINDSDVFSVYERFDELQEANYMLNQKEEYKPICLSKFVINTTASNYIEAGNPLNHAELQKNRFKLFVHKAYVYANKKYSDIILSHFIEGNIPKSGIILIFSEWCKYCYITEYFIEHKRVTLHFVDRIKNPNAIMNIDKLNELQNPIAKNSIKRFLTSGHKVIIHRNVLTHVDRRHDINVFGPSIDTLILADNACEIAYKIKAKKILEIGCGNGHIITSLAITMGLDLKVVHYWDINPYAIICTYKNFNANKKYKYGNNINALGFVGKFDCNILKEMYDLIVCNPPYIADLSNSIAVEDITEDDLLKLSVSGIDLIELILQNGKRILSNGGRILIIISSSSLLLDKILTNNDWDVKVVNEYTIPFDVEAILINNNLVKKLEKMNAIFLNRDQTYNHKIYVLELKKKEVGYVARA